MTDRPFPQPRSVEECLMLITVMQAEARSEARYTSRDTDRRILWGMCDALGELARRIRDGIANTDWAYPNRPREPALPADRGSR